MKNHDSDFFDHPALHRSAPLLCFYKVALETQLRRMAVAVTIFSLCSAISAPSAFPDLQVAH
jgi:hypothetical protein